MLYGSNLVCQGISKDSLQSIGGFSDAVAFSVDPLGNIFVIDNGSNELVKLAISENNISRVGGYGWTETAFDKPRDIISPNGLDVYVADYGNHRVLRFDRNLNLLSIVPSGDNDPRKSRTFGYPLSIALSRFGKLFILDSENKRLVKISKENTIESSIGGTDAGRGRLRKPIKVRISNKDHIYIQDDNQILVYDIFGNYLRSIGKGIFQHISTFTIEGDTIYALDSCIIHRMDIDGKSKHQINLDKYIGNCYNVIDIYFNDHNMFFLTKNEVFFMTITNNL